VAKLVVDSGTSADAFSSATATLALAVSSVCQESYTSVLWEERGAVDSGTIVDRALDHLHQRFVDPDLSLAAVAAALECSPNYLTQRFTQVLGQRMHGYIVALRVDRACRELLSTDLPIRRIAQESGFRDAAGLSRAFHRQVGVSPSEYRRIFAGR
jgi:AraC-like DNA-binding protein